MVLTKQQGFCYSNNISELGQPAMSKVRIAYPYRNDFGILQQEIENAIKKAFQQLQPVDQSGEPVLDAQNKTALQRRLEQFYASSTQKFRSLVVYSKSKEKDKERVELQPDQNLEKINQIKTQMLHQAIIRNRGQKWPPCRHQWALQQPKQVVVAGSEQSKESLNSVLQQKQGKVIKFDKEISRISGYQDLLVRAATKIQKLQRDLPSFARLK